MSSVRAADPAQLPPDIEQRGKTERQGRPERDATRASIVLPGHAGEASGIASGQSGHRERKATVITAIGKGLHHGVPDPRAQSVAVAELVVIVRAAVHERGEAMADAHLRHVLGDALADLSSQAARGIVLTELLDQSATDNPYDGAPSGQVV